MNTITELAPRRATPRRIAVFRALQLGDLLCAVPALRAVRNGFPDSEITLIGLPWAREFARRFARLVDRFVEFPGFPGLPEREPDLPAIPRFLADEQAACYDLAIQMHGRGDLTNSIVAALGAKSTAGFCPPGGPCPDALRFLPWPETGTEIHRCIALTDFLGLPRAGDRLEFPLDDDELAQADALLSRHSLVPRRFVCIHPGARLYTRRWPFEYFATVAQDVVRRGFRIVLTGSSEEALITRRIGRALPAGSYVDLAGETALGVFGAVLRHARLLVANDTGVSHVAAALRVPSVVVCCGADPQRFAPLDHVLHEVLHHAVACRPCSHVHCPIGHPCAQKLVPERVLLRVRARLAPKKPVEPLRLPLPPGATNRLDGATTPPGSA
ncbi:MAG TPA: glycosyltransferase family 9 protein [Casimicrobiaceae bacterium]|jgi:ADP-heptose:LPS heptosyltransferase|nr:glycosyltransferase family 9 protein [Casimicrobiaceae bacterium]